MSYDCECPVAGFCTRHQTRKTQRDWELCQGINTTPEKAAKYRAMWDGRTSTQSVRTPADSDGPPERIAVPAKTYEPIPRDQWPAAASLIAALSTPEDRGVGDTIKRELGRAGKVYQAAFRLLTGHACTGCSFRQSKWNQLYPY